MSILMRRVEVTQQTLDAWNGKAVELGKTDCARLGADHMRRNGRTPKLLMFGRYSTEEGARAALKRKNCETLADAVELQGLFRIPFAKALVGDVFVLRSDNGIGALGICLGHRQVLMFNEGVCQPCRMRPAFFPNLLGCWQVFPET